MPAIIVFDRDRKELARIHSFVPPEKLIPVLRDAKRGMASTSYPPVPPR